MLRKKQHELLLRVNFPSSELLIHRLEKEGRPVLLSFSCGKDAIAAWLRLRGRVEVVPFYLFLVPGLGFVERALKYYEDFFGQAIMQLPNPHFYRMLNNAVYQAPENVWKAAACRLPDFSTDDLRGEICDDKGLDPDTWVVTGVRSADSLNRRAAMQTHGPVSERRRQMHVVWDMKKDKLVEVLRESGVKLPVDYELFGKTFDGLDYRFTGPIKQRFPEDYEIIKEWFPMIECERMRYEREAKN